MTVLIQGNGLSLPTEIDPKNNICLVVTHLDGSKEWDFTLIEKWVVWGKIN